MYALGMFCQDRRVILVGLTRHLALKRYVPVFDDDMDPLNLLYQADPQICSQQQPKA